MSKRQNTTGTTTPTTTRKGRKTSKRTPRKGVTKKTSVPKNDVSTRFEVQDNHGKLVRVLNHRTGISHIYGKLARLAVYLETEIEKFGKVSHSDLQNFAISLHNDGIVKTPLGSVPVPESDLRPFCKKDSWRFPVKRTGGNWVYDESVTYDD